LHVDCFYPWESDRCARPQAPEEQVDHSPPRSAVVGHFDFGASASSSTTRYILEPCRTGSGGVIGSTGHPALGWERTHDAPGPGPPAHTFLLSDSQGYPVRLSRSARETPMLPVRVLGQSFQVPADHDDGRRESLRARGPPPHDADAFCL
jgi:hypothetical protein